MRKLILSTVCLLFFQSAVGEPVVEVVGLFKGKAVLKVDSRQTVIGVGETSREGVTLVSADSKSAVIEISGQRQTLYLSRQISAGFKQPETREIRINKNLNDQYRVNGTINGRRLVFLVDTGANVLAMSSLEAARLGIDYTRDGKKSRVVTASGIVPSWEINIPLVEVGGIEARNIAAQVIEGSHPQDVLLGMSYLRHVDIEEKNGVMVLQQKY
jgi:aspartyl protease family protein